MTAYSSACSQAFPPSPRATRRSHTNSASATDRKPSTPQTVRVEYRLNATGNYSSVLAIPTGGEHNVTLPGIPCGNSVQFRFAVNTTAGGTVIAPIDNACASSTFSTSAFDSFIDNSNTFENGAQGWLESGLAGGVFIWQTDDGRRAKPDDRRPHRRHNARPRKQSLITGVETSCLAAKPS